MTTDLLSGASPAGARRQSIVRGLAACTVVCWLIVLIPAAFYQYIGLSVEGPLRGGIAAVAVVTTLALLALGIWTVPTLWSRDLEAPPAPGCLSERRLLALVLYNFALAALLIVALGGLLYLTPYVGDELIKDPAAVARVGIPDILSYLLATLGLVLVAGGLGGVVSNLGGIFERVSATGGKEKALTLPMDTYETVGHFPARFEKPFYVRPVLAATVGLLSFFVGSFLGKALGGAAITNWWTLSGRLSYVAVALLAGFIAYEFTQRLKEVARSTFGIGDQMASEKGPDATEPGAGDGERPTLDPSPAPVTVPPPAGASSGPVG